MWSTAGHDLVKKILEEQLKRQCFPHAYLFVGPTGIGKQGVAHDYAAALLGLTGIAKLSNALRGHPDFISFDAAGGTGVEGMRELLSRLNVKPFIGKYKVAVINNFEAATIQTANALLKTLEEPSLSTIIITISSRRNLLPTIISRSQEFIFNKADSSVKMGVDQSLAELVTKLDATYRGSMNERLLMINELSELAPETLIELLISWIRQLRSTLSRAPEQVVLIRRILETLQSLQQSLNKKMVLQHLLIS